MSILRLPVGTNASGNHPERIAGQVRDADPAGNEKTRIVRQAVQVAFARGAIPSDEGIAIGAFPRRGAEQGAGHDASAPVPRQIANILAHGVAVAEVVLVGKQAMMPDVTVLAPKSLRERITEKLRDGLRARR